MQDKHVQILVVIRNGLVEEVRSNVDLAAASVLVMDLDANPLTEGQENHIVGKYKHAVEPEQVDESYLAERKLEDL